MIFLRLILTFLKIGTFNFGGGYAMLSLIQDEVVVRHGWLSMQEFTEVVALSQMTPGPIGVNTATFVGYTAVADAGYGVGWALVGALCATTSVLVVPFVLCLAVSQYLQRNGDQPLIRRLMSTLRRVVVGLVAAAALSMMTVETFGRPLLADGVGATAVNPQFLFSCAVFVVVFLLAYFRKMSPVWLLLLAAAAGVVYGHC